MLFLISGYPLKPMQLAKHLANVILFPCLNQKKGYYIFFAVLFYVTIILIACLSVPIDYRRLIFNKGAYRQ